MTGRDRVVAWACAVLMAGGLVMLLCGLGDWTSILIGLGFGGTLILVFVYLSDKRPPR